VSLGLDGAVWWAATLAGCALIASVSLIGLALLRHDGERRSLWIPRLLAFAVGVLTGDALLHLLPHSVESIGFGLTAAAAGAGLGLFAVVAYFLPKGGTPGVAAMAPVSLGSDAIHNVGDGALIALAFATSPLLGVATVVAVLAHEVPQELGDFAILIDAGLSPLKAAAANLASALTIFLGAFAGLLLGSAAETFLQGLAPVAAGGFLYLALFVVLPALRRHSLRQGQVVRERVLPMAMGVGMMAMLAFAEARLGLDHGHVHGLETPSETRSFAPWRPPGL